MSTSGYWRLWISFSSLSSWSREFLRFEIPSGMITQQISFRRIREWFLWGLRAPCPSELIGDGNKTPRSDRNGQWFRKSHSILPSSRIETSTPSLGKALLRAYSTLECARPKLKAGQITFGMRPGGIRLIGFRASSQSCLFPDKDSFCVVLVRKKKLGSAERDSPL